MPETKYKVWWKRGEASIGRLEGIESGDVVTYILPTSGFLLAKGIRIPLDAVREVERPVREEERELSPLERLGFILPDDQSVEHLWHRRRWRLKCNDSN